MQRVRAAALHAALVQWVGGAGCDLCLQHAACDAHDAACATQRNTQQNALRGATTASCRLPAGTPSPSRSASTRLRRAAGYVSATDCCPVIAGAAQPTDVGVERAHRCRRSPGCAAPGHKGTTSHVATLQCCNVATLQCCNAAMLQCCMLPIVGCNAPARPRGRRVFPCSTSPCRWRP